MRNDKHLAEKLRRKNKSYNQISQELDIPKSTLVYWFRDKNWSQKIKNELSRKALYVAKKRLRLINKARREKWEKWREEHRQVARKEFASFIKDPLFVAGINLYWAEGDSVLENGSVRLTNTDPRMIGLFVKFLEEVIKIPREKIKCALILYPDLVEKKCKLFWSEVSGIPYSQFHKTQIIKGRHPTKRLKNGICMIQFSSRGLKEKIMVWIDLFHKQHIA